MEGYNVDKESLDKVISKNLQKVEILRKKVSDENLILGIRLLFTDNNGIYVSPGSLAENIDIYSVNDFNDNSGFLDDDHLFDIVLDKKLLSYDLIDDNGYCYNSIILNFENQSIEIYATLDDLGVVRR